MLALLAVVAIVTSRGDAPVYEPYSSTDYRAGGYRAWADLLAHEGVDTMRFVLRPIELGDGIDTLISAQPPPRIGEGTARTAADVGALAAWVRGGGRLVYVGRNATLDDAETKLLQLPFFLPNVGGRGPLSGPLAVAVPSMQDLGTNRMLLVEHPGRALLADGNGDIVVRYRLGRGEIVAAVDAAPFTNANIVKAENARLAYLLAAPRRAGAVVAFDDGLHGALVDRPWYRALPIALRVSLAIAAVALVLGLIGSALPGSPPMRLQPIREPTSVEFVHALAALYERTGARDAARSILAHEALAASAQSRGDVDLRRLERTLDTPVKTDADLLASARLAYIVRKDSTYGGNGDGRRAAFAGRTRTRRRR